MRVGYIRSSKDYPDLDLQINALKEYGVDQIYKNKQKLTEVLGKLHTGDTLVVWQLHKLGMTVKQFLYLAESFENRGIYLVSLQDNFDTSNATGQVFFKAFCILAQMERNVISERTKEGLSSARKKGRLGGRKPKEDANIKKALEMYYSNNFSIKEITESTGLCKTSIYKYVKKYNKIKEENEIGTSK